MFACHQGLALLCTCMHVCKRRKGDGQLTLRELQRGDLLEALQWLDKEPDINKVRPRNTPQASTRARPCMYRMHGAMEHSRATCMHACMHRVHVLA